MRVAKYLTYCSILFLLSNLVTAVSSAQTLVFSPPPSVDETTEEPEESREDIVAETIAGCAANPESCGITLSSFLDSVGFAETEPNDYMLGADALAFDTQYAGQLYNADDEDWYYITMKESNQLLTVGFSVPGLGSEDTGTGTSAGISNIDISGWNISVRDSGGNIFSEVNSGFDGKPDTLLQTALSHAGTYYIVIKKDPAAQTANLFYDYNVTAFLEASQLTSEPVDVNFFDAEVEPNDIQAEANLLTSNVTMMGLLSNTLLYGSGGFNFERDWFVYESKGNEILTIEFCVRQDCEGGQWEATLISESGMTLAKGRTDKEKKYYFGIRDPGRYFLRLDSIPGLVDENGGVIHLCTPDPGTGPVWNQYNFTVTSTHLPPLISEVNSSL